MRRFSFSSPLVGLLCLLFLLFCSYCAIPSYTVASPLRLRHHRHQNEYGNSPSQELTKLEDDLFRMEHELQTTIEGEQEAIFVDQAEADEADDIAVRPSSLSRTTHPIGSPSSTSSSHPQLPRSILKNLKSTIFPWQDNNCEVDPNGHIPLNAIDPNGNHLQFQPDVQVLSPYKTCGWVPSYCYNSSECPTNSPNIITPFIPLTQKINIFKNVLLAQQVAKSFPNSQTVINSNQNLLTLHTSLEYFCCYNNEESQIITNVLKDYKWKSFELELDSFGCDADNDQVYVLAEASASSQTSLFSLVHGIESAVTQAGVRIKQPRVERFHATIANVNYKYPTDCMVNKLMQTWPNGVGKVKVCCFMTMANGGIQSYFAEDCLSTGLCVIDML